MSSEVITRLRMALLILILFPALIQGQGIFSSDLNALKANLGNMPEDTNKVAALATLANGVNNSDSALAFAFQGIELAQRLRDVNGEISCIHYAGNIYYNMGNYAKALEFYLKEEKIIEKSPFKSRMAAVYNGLGNVYSVQSEFDKAISYYQKGLEIIRSLDSTHARRAVTYHNNLGNAYVGKKDYDKAIGHFRETVRLNLTAREIDSYSLGNAYNSLGELFIQQLAYDSALIYFEKALEHYHRIGMNQRIASQHNNIARLHYLKGDYRKALGHYEISLKELQNVKANEVLSSSFNGLAETYFQLGDFKKAFEFQKQYTTIKDTLLNSENLRIISEMNTKYETEKKDKEILQKDAESRERGMQRNFFIAGFALMMILAFYIFRGYRQKQKANRIISDQKQEVEAQREQLREKNKDILDSINYAQRIQQAILPTEDEMKQHFSESFVLFRPKDIVSGDFFWTTEKNGYVFFAAADCTGHGVPGGFMSMLGTSLLNETVNEKNVLEPADILDLLRIKIINALKQKGSTGENKDGMDMCLCRIDKARSELVYAAANNPLWMIRNNTLTEFPCDKQPVGISGGAISQFSQQSISVQPGDIFYAFTDGYADQFGGEKGKKFMYKRMQKHVIDISTASMNEQKRKLSEAFDSWKGNHEQVDDVCIIGVKITGK